MTTANPTSTLATFDCEPLSWVIDEIRETLNRSSSALTLVLAQPPTPEERLPLLRQAKNHLHQAHGALQMVDVDGVALLTETVENMFECMLSGELALASEIVATVEQGYGALIEYLQELLAGEAPQPLRLFPYYRDLLQASGSERIHPADLFFANLANRPLLRTGATTASMAQTKSAGIIDYTTVRKRFEKALLPFLKGTPVAVVAGNGEQLHDIVGEVEAAQTDMQLRGFWWVMRGFAEAVATGKIDNDRYVKQLFAQINLQIRRLAEGTGSIAERLLRDALFFISRVDQPTPLLQQIRAAYGLSAQGPADFNEKRYGRVDRKALLACGEHLAQAKALWNRSVAGDTQAAHAFEQKMQSLQQASSALQQPALTSLLLEMTGIAGIAANGESGERLGLEMATGLLFVETTLNQIATLPAHFASHAQAMTVRLLASVDGAVDGGQTQADVNVNAIAATPVPWLDDMSRLAQQRQTVVTLAGELQSSLQQVEKMLEGYFADPAETAALTPVNAILHQVGGALAILDQEEAARAVAHTRKALEVFADASMPLEIAECRQQFQHIARNIGALGFFVETLHLHDDKLEKRFFFDDSTGIFQARVFERVVPIPENEDHAPAVESFALPVITPEISPTTETPALEAEPVQTIEEVDAELLGIFLMEAVEVLETVRTTLPLARQEPHSQEHLATLRRSFHTLKGSGRMVGLTAFGEVAWSIEQLINLRLSQNHSADADLCTLLESAASTLSSWVEELQAHGRSDRTAQALIDAAARLGEMGAVDVAVESVVEPVVEAVAVNAPESDDSLALEVSAQEQAVHQDAEDIQQQVTRDAADRPDAPLAVPLASTPPASKKTSIVEFPSPAASQPPRNDNLRQIGDIEISVALHAIYMAESDGLTRLLSLDFGEWRHECERPVNLLAIHAAHSLAGTSATVGFKPLQELAQALEAVLQLLARATVPLQSTEFDLLDRVVERIRFMLQLFALGEMADHEPLQVRALERLLDTLGSRIGAPAAASGVALAANSAVNSALTPAITPAVTPLPDINKKADDDMPTLAALLSKQSVETPVSTQTDTIPTPAPVASPVSKVSLTRTEPEQGLPFAGRDVVIKDEFDADLMPVFLDEASEMLPQMGQLLRAWQLTPTESASPQALLRLLHTIKGSARMAGAMRFGQQMHDMESRIEQVMHLSQQPPQVMEDLLSRHDLGLQMFDALQHYRDPTVTSLALPAEHDRTVDFKLPQPTSFAAETVIEDQNTAIGGTERRGERRLPSDVVNVNATPVPLVRVRADTLDRLVNQAGEVSIARSRLESDVGTMHQSLAELTENVARLREQLREVEMQAESQIENQISSQRANSPEKQFDPLEFDRFTRLQELTRMMAESVNDVGAVQQTLTRTLDSASADLTMQARLTRELQQDLMSVRMVQFASVTERLYRVTRQTSKEVDKRVTLDIRGSTVELDRSVLERMTGPFEHLLRNAIVHGIEDRAARQSAGKNEVGELQIEVRQEGNEVVIEFSDDGSGLSIERIRNKALQTGLLDADSTLSEAELSDLIFHPGFSTAAEVTPLAGRGIGMDVVRAEATALGGRVAIDSAPGKGATFTIHLPLTLAVTQVVLLTTGGKTYAVPSVLVEQVQQLKAPALVAAYKESAVTWQSQRVPMVYLASLLGESGVSAMAQQYSPLIILKNGSHRLAVHVDEILGNREVVVKNIGAQLARLTGIAGATVLGSGEIVLILNPVALAQRATLEQCPISLPHDDTENSGPSDTTPDGAPPVLQTQRIVMVVDDSLTVRRVTQRLLTREGYQVVLAKDGIDALEQLQSVTPDVMLVDIEMPRMDGFDLTRNLRGDERTRNIAIIMITSRSAAKHRNHAFELGVDEYLGKPYQEEVLLSAIAGFVQKAVLVSN